MKTTFHEQRDRIQNRVVAITGAPDIDIQPIVDAHIGFLRTTLENALDIDLAIEYCAQTLNSQYY